MAQDFALPRLPLITWLTLPVMALLIATGLLMLPTDARLPSSAMLPAIGALGLILLIVMPALRRRRITLDNHRLQVAATFYTRNVSVDALDLGQARIIDFPERSEYRPMLRLNGVALPGLSAGHYLLRNRQRAFCLLIGRGRALLLPQRDGRLLLLSPDQPQALLDALRATAGATR